MSSRPPRRRRKLRPDTADAIENLSRGQTEWGMEYQQWRGMRHPSGFTYQLYHVYVNLNQNRQDTSPPGGTIYTRRDGLFNTPEDVEDYVNSDSFDEEIADEEESGAQYLTSIVYAVPENALIVPGARGRYSSYEIRTGE